MARLFSSFRIAPGVRLSTSSRGLRAHVGPRAARLHVGGGRTGVSTGAGPFTVYQSGTVPVPVPRNHEDRAAAQAAARDHLARIEHLHRIEFPALERAVAPRVPLPRFATLLATAEKKELRGISPFDRTARQEAKQEARRLAETWAHDLLTLASHEHHTQQATLDAQWSALVANEPATVSATVSEAYAATGTPARLIDVVDGVGFVQVTGPSDAEVPLVTPRQTAAGAPTVARLNQTERAQWHRLLVAAHALVAAKQTLAVAPGLSKVCLVVMRPGDPAEPLLAATIGRDRLASADFSQRAGQVLDVVAENVIVRVRGGTGELQPIRVAADSAYGLLVR